MLGHSLRFSNAYVARKKRHQIPAFAALREEFSSIYDRGRRHDYAAYTTEWWEGEAEKLEAAFLPVPPTDFLQNPSLRWAMVSDNAHTFAAELPELERAYDTEHLLAVLEEDIVGAPILGLAKYHTTLNSVHHAYHTHRFIDATGCDPRDVDSVVEWGGGYGSLAKIFLRWAQRPVTYTIIDIPLMSAVQWLYLSCVLGPEQVTFVDSLDTPIEEGKVNILPVGLAEERAPDAELMISTWALGESSKRAYELVLERNWFGADRLFLGYADSDELFPDGGVVGEMAKARGATLHQIEFLPWCHYAFL
ncbi:hypothetical protein HN371_05740 [Candidatus Poribacteria bacterium]|jgi:hypothetical protein|nr:hypothetical protein [Candidatus Poribacteria bacterium]MBT5715177.1 hypothetical protein [Candidatus Poribacteria bacterium]MBT7098726.1 hypothetical protein [Candidatus Poribacteria bacterium]MBT7806285.1 hypothetical protein [Candidatus Poribacteria bacterium]